MKNRRIGSFQITVGIIVLALVAFVAWLWGAQTADSRHEISSTTIDNSFESIAELAVEEYHYTNVGKFSGPGLEIFGLEVPLTDRSFLVTYSGSVEAGIDDISQVSTEIDDDKQIITITVPAVSVLSSHIDPASIEVYDQSFNPVNQMRVEDVITFLDSETDKGTQVATENGLLDRAEKRTGDLLSSHVESMIEGSSLAEYDVVVDWSDDI